MLSIAELAHQRDPEAIAEIIRQELYPLGIESLDVEVAIADSSLELQIRTDAAIDKEKLLTLVRSKFQNLPIESVAKFRIHNWRNDPEMHEQRLLWTEQFMLDSPQPMPSYAVEPDLAPVISPERRSPEPQLSKHSVLQQAIAKISPNNPTAKNYLLASEVDQQPVGKSLTGSELVLKSHPQQKPPSFFNNSYWQLLLVGLSIVLLGLGIGASVKALTAKNGTEVNSSSVDNTSVKATATPSFPSKGNDSSETIAKNSSKTNPSGSETLTPSPNSTISANTSAIATQEEKQVVTLEKFNRIQKGMTVEQVEKIFGAAGKVIAENSSNNMIGQVYSWKNPQGSNAIIEFKDGQVVAKAQAGL